MFPDPSVPIFIGDLLLTVSATLAVYLISRFVFMRHNQIDASRIIPNAVAGWTLVAPLLIFYFADGLYQLPINLPDSLWFLEPSSPFEIFLLANKILCFVVAAIIPWKFIDKHSGRASEPETAK